MKMYDGGIVEVPMCSILFDDLEEFADFEKLAKYDGLGKDWAISILRIYLQCFKDCTQKGDKPFSWDDVGLPG